MSEKQQRYYKAGPRKAALMARMGCVPVLEWVPPARKKELEAFAKKLRAEAK